MMKEQDKKREQQARWLQEHVLDKKQFEKLIAQKFKRAQEYQEAVTKREALCGDR